MSRLGTLLHEVPSPPTDEAQKPYPSRLWSSRLGRVVPTAEVDGDSTAEMEVDHMAALKEGCRPSGTWAEHP
jgi:hypothetical protein